MFAANSSNNKISFPEITQAGKLDSNNMDKIDPTLMSYLKGPYGAASLPSLNDVNKMQLALPGYGKQSKSQHIKRLKESF